MGVWTLEGTLDNDSTGAVLVDSVTMTAFGPVFTDGAEAESFLAWLDHDTDPRTLEDRDLLDRVQQFRLDEIKRKDAIRVTWPVVR